MENSAAIRDRDGLAYLRVVGPEAVNPPLFFPNTREEAQYLTEDQLNSLLTSYQQTEETENMSIAEKKSFFQRFIGLFE